MAEANESMLLCHSVCCWVLLAGNTQEAGCKAMLILHISKDKAVTWNWRSHQSCACLFLPGPHGQ